ncbi:uncharacterized protein TRIVIDRAFT_70851 [Trichoderma virens Gv29-8]|uniref:Uncharacterized protein n=1 Tax=Hypocrea virens (strain Gv29-8 / FGSC 10586) TaxID=413071 RepID=G9MUG2_HYPVG|nr:uncharacterized protein TRIVIDRAFT_70851 [Trichoderma virens Gv29-8]EHK21906.1 hypothetical protein TRIVIDRAFT_70851 [Trichoderma virens Gv29-8]UKZ54359.1 hypothetical protein TrVGV298_008167 [Trichoderma virens]
MPSRHHEGWCHLLKLARVAPEASGTNFLSNWFPEREERADCVITSRLTSPKSPFPYSAAAETAHRLGGTIPQFPPAGPGLSCSAPECSEWFKKFAAVTINIPRRSFELHYGQTEEPRLPETSYPMLFDQPDITRRHSKETAICISPDLDTEDEDEDD